MSQCVEKGELYTHRVGSIHTHTYICSHVLWASQVVLVVKNSPTNVGDVRDRGSGRSPEGGHGNPLQYSCLENPMEREPGGAMVHRITESDTTEVT